ncbi:hypothetical protein Hdeb2414_s0006g00190291 [Helianthus debilis subsp. tardiflorus]
MRLLKDNKETLRRLFDNLSEPETVQHLRCFYEENSTANFCDMEFSKMMLLDSCFILYYFRIFFGGSLEDHPELSRKQLATVYEDLLLLENMIAYETYCCSIYDAWVTSYVCLLDSLIDDVEDVKVLRKGWVIHNHLSSDKEVATLFEEIAIDLFPNSLAYHEAMNKIQTHYESLSNTLFSQLKNEYFKSPWAIFALLGALIALFLAGVQTYFTVWSPESKCDDLCVFLKMNHHFS